MPHQKALKKIQGIAPGQFGVNLRQKTPIYVSEVEKIRKIKVSLHLE